MEYALTPDRAAKAFRRLPAVLCSALLGLALILAQTAPAAAERDEVAEGFVSELAKETLSVLSKAEESREQRVETFRQLVVKNVDLKRFGRSALGRRYARMPSEEEFAEYLDALEDYAVEILFSQFSLFADHGVRVTNSDMRQTRSATYVIVATDIIDPNKQVAAVVQWIMRKSDDTYKMFDVQVQSTDGSASFSMLTTQRDEFTQVLNQNGGSMAGLITYLKDGTAKIRARAEEKEESANAASNSKQEASLR